MPSQRDAHEHHGRSEQTGSRAGNRKQAKKLSVQRNVNKTREKIADTRSDIITPRDTNSEAAHVQKEVNNELENNNLDSERLDDSNELDNRRYRRPEVDDTHELAKSPSPPPQPERFSLEKFNNDMNNFAEMFSSPKYATINDDYPVDEMTALVADVRESVEEFKNETMTSQRHLEELREKMRVVKERIQANIQKKTNALRMENEEKTGVQEREATERVARLNTEVARANAELADALRLQTETENVAAQAQLATELTKDEARSIEEELAFRAKVEERRKEQEKRKMEEARRKAEEERLQQEEELRQKEAEWKRREAGSEKTPTHLSWPTYDYKISHPNIQLGCIVRGHPTKFDHRSIDCQPQDQIQSSVPFSPGEELVSLILSLGRGEETDTLQEPIVVCIPFIAPRQTAHVHASREPVMKMLQGDQWVSLESIEETIDKYKEYKFATAEVSHLSKMAVFTRIKQDYATVSRRGGKVTSSYDQRVTMTVPRNSVQGNDHILMEVQPVDTSSVNDLRHRNTTCKGLLTSSPIIHMAWESTTFKEPVTVTVPCPPNPAKAKKIADMRKAKEDKMKNPHRITVLLPHEIDAMEKERQKSKLQRMQDDLAEAAAADSRPTPTKWYMGEYANNEDDESDNLYLVSKQAGKWTPVPDVKIAQVKLDLLEFDLEKPLDKFMVLRTRTNVDEDSIGPMANDVASFISQKFVQVILKQRSDNPFDTLLSVVPVTKTDKTLKKLSEEGYDDGPDPSPVVTVSEGDVIQVCFRGNVTKKEDSDIEFVYNSNIESETDFTACEVDKYLQKNFPVYRGVAEVYRKFEVKPVMRKTLQRKDSREEHEVPKVEMKRELVCELSINIPKYNVESNNRLVKAPITIKNPTDPINDEFLRYIADELGDEWRVLASHLNVSKPRVQAIIRNMTYNDLNESDARYDMLMTWLKKTPKAVDKVAFLTNAMLKSGRGDIAEDIRTRDREFRTRQQRLMPAK